MRVLLLICLLITNASGRAVAPQGKDSLDAVFSKAAELYSSGLYWAAEPLFRQVASARPQFSSAQFGVAMCLHQTKRSEESLKFFEAAARGGKPEGQHFGQWSRALDWLSRTDEAGVIADRGLTIDPRQPLCLYVKALLAKRAERIDEARKGFQSVLALDPDNVDAIGELADLEWRAGRLDEAEKLAGRLLAGAAATRGYYLRSRIARSRGDAAATRRFIEAWKKSMAEDEKRTAFEVKINGWLALGYQLLAKNEPQEAMGYFLQVIEIDRANAHARNPLSGFLKFLEDRGQGSSAMAEKLRAALRP